MTGLLAFLLVPIAIGLTVSAVLVWRRRPDAVAGAPAGPGVADALRRARRRLGAVLLATAAVLVFGMVLNGLAPAWLGLPLALSPGVAATLALLGSAAAPVRPDLQAGPVTASLTRRRVRDAGRNRSFVLPALVAVAYLGFLGWCTAVATPDDQGRLRALSATVVGPGAVTTVGHSPFPGSFYALPLAGVTLVLTLSTWLALRRVASLPAVSGAATDATTRVADAGWREVSTRVIVRTATATLLGYAGATLVVAGLGVRGVAVGLVLNGQPSPTPVWVGTAVALLGLATLLGGVALATTAVVAVLSLRAPLPVRPDRAVGAHLVRR